MSTNTTTPYKPASGRIMVWDSIADEIQARTFTEIAVTAPISADTQAALNLKENLANRATTLVAPNNTNYPTTKAVADAIALIPPDKYILGGNVVGTNMIFTLSDNSTASVDVTNLVNLPDVRLKTGVYNTATLSIDFTLTNGNIISVPAADLLKVIHDNTITGDGATIPLSIPLSADSNNGLKLGTDGRIFASSGIKKYRVIQSISIGTNNITHNLALTTPFATQVEVRDNLTGALIPVRVMTETSNSLEVISPSAITLAKITIIG